MVKHKLYERYQHTDSTFGIGTTEDYHLGIAFTIGNTGDNETVNLYKFRLHGGYPSSLPGNIVFSLYKYDGDLPTGGIASVTINVANLLSTVTIDGNSLNYWSNRDWFDVVMPTCSLESDTTYILNIKATNDSFYLSADQTGVYSGGGYVYIYYTFWPSGWFIKEYDATFQLYGIWPLDGPSSKVVTTSERTKPAVTTSEEDNPVITTSERTKPSVTSSTY